MSKTAFEIRLELLYLSRDILTAAHELEKEEIRENFFARLNEAQVEHMPVPALSYGSCKPPSGKEIMSLAAVLDDSFISKKS